MQRNYLALALLGCSGAALAASLSGAAVARAAALFEARPVDASRFAVLARAVGRDDWTLLVLEQLRPAPLCWQTRADGLVDPSLNRFDFSGICGRYIDSNGYSVRFGNGEEERDGAAGLRLRLEQVGQELQLQAASPDQAGVLVVGRAAAAARQRDAFVPLQLEPGWELRRRSYGSQSLNHLYFAHGASARELLERSAAAPGSTQRLTATRRPFPVLLAPPPPPPLATPITTRTRSSAWRRQAPSPAPEAEAATPSLLPQQGRTIALQVIPFQE
jgi:hypothetical protein